MISTHRPRIERVVHTIGRGGGLTIVQASDVHAGSQSVRRAFEALAAELPGEADLVVVTGDSVMRRDAEDAAFVARVLRENVKARVGCFAVLGNHDYAVTGPPGRETRPDVALAAEVTARMKDAGFTVLRNEWTQPTPEIVVAGADDVGARQIDPDATLRDAPEDVLRLLLVHNPDGAHAVLARYRADVVLCGHTHAGQVRLPGMRPPLVNLHIKRYWRGAFRLRGSSMYVSRGFGASHLPLRVWARPEITVHELV